jgi:hypothetical protein
VSGTSGGDAATIISTEAIMGNDHHGNEHEHTEHTEHTESTGDGGSASVTHESTTTESAGSYVDSDIPEDGDTTSTEHGGGSGDEEDGEFTDSDIPADR